MIDTHGIKMTHLYTACAQIQLQPIKNADKYALYYNYKSGEVWVRWYKLNDTIITNFGSPDIYHIYTSSRAMTAQEIADKVYEYFIKEIYFA